MEKISFRPAPSHVVMELEREMVYFLRDFFLHLQDFFFAPARTFHWQGCLHPQGGLHHAGRILWECNQTKRQTRRCQKNGIATGVT